MKADARNSFRAVLESAGLRPGEITPDGGLHRCLTDGKPKGKDGAYVFHPDPPASGWWKNWRTGEEARWTAREEWSLSPTERQVLQARIEADRKARDAEAAKRHAEAKNRAKYVLGTARDCTAHPYLEHKGARICPGLKVGQDGRLIVPVLSPEDGVPMSLQLIALDGAKRFLTGGKVQGGFFPIQGNTGRLYICEGLATGLSIHEASGQTVICAFNAGNLQSVASHARKKYPERELVLCADNDHATPGNPGLSMASATALAVGALLAVPHFKEPAGRSDFNDLHQAEGLEAVRGYLLGASLPGSQTSSGPDNPIVPIGFATPNLPDIDPAMLPPILGEFCEAVAEGLQVSFELVLINALACVAVAGQRKFKVLVRTDYAEPVNIYAVAALPPGERKSPTVAVCKAPLVQWECQAQEEAQESIRNALSERKTLERAIEAKRTKAGSAKTAGARREIIDEIKALEAELPEVPASPRLLIDDVTPEAIPAFMEHQQERAGIIEAEGGLFDMLAGRYSKGVPNLDAVLKFWSGEPVHVDRKGGPPIVLRDPALTICLSAQPEVIHELVSKPGFRGRGFVGRFLFLMPRSLVGSRNVEPTPIPLAVQEQYATKLRSLLALPWALGSDGKPVPYMLSLEPAAYSAWLDFHRGVEWQLRPGGELEPMADWGCKLHGAAIRLAGLLHLAEHDAPHQRPIDQDTMRQALGLAEIFTEHAKAAFALMGADPDIECARHILAWILERRIESFQARDAFEKVKGRYQKMDKVRAGLSVLEEHAFIFPTAMPVREPGKAGRCPSPLYNVNPLAHRRGA